MSVPSISAGDISFGWLNLTNAPPSLSRGTISVTLMGTDSGIARLTSWMGFMTPRDELSKRRSKSVRSSSECHGRHVRNVSLRGNKSRSQVSKAIDIGLMRAQAAKRLTIKEQDRLIRRRSDVPALLIAGDGALSAPSGPS